MLIADRRQSEVDFLHALLRELGGAASAIGLAPAELVRAVRRNGTPPRGLEILGMPSRPPVDAPRSGDWMLRAVPGGAEAGHVSLLASDSLLSTGALTAEGIDAEGKQSGYYAIVVEAGAFPHDGARPFARRILDGRGRVPPGTLLLRPMSASFSPASDEAQTQYDAAVNQLRKELNLPFADPDDPGLHARRGRLRALFRTLSAADARTLRGRLGATATGDELSRLFHHRLATATRGELLKILDQPLPTASPPAPTAPSARKCRRELGWMGQLLPWERRFLALVHEKNPSDFDGVGVFVGPIILPGAMPAALRPIVETALKNSYAITIGNNIWFPRAIDTSTVGDLVWLVHESVHVVDYANAGTEAFLQAYVAQGIMNQFRHDDIPLEKRANRIEGAAAGMLHRFPDFVKAIATCDGAAIEALLQQKGADYRAAFYESMPEEALDEAPDETPDAEVGVDDALDPRLLAIAEKTMAREESWPSEETVRRWTKCFSAQDVARVEQAYKDNAAAAAGNGGDRCSCIVMLNVALGQLLSLSLKDNPARGKSTRTVKMGDLTTKSIEKAMAQLVKTGYAEAATSIDFFDRRKRTAGTLKPESLKESVQAKVVKLADTKNCWFAFGLSIMDGYHSVLLLVDYTGSDAKIYWLDQFSADVTDDVTTTLDDRITSKTQAYWQAVYDEKRIGYKTMVRLWPLRKPAPATAEALDESYGPSTPRTPGNSQDDLDVLSEAPRPDPGRIYEFVRDLLNLQQTDPAGFKKLISGRFKPKTAVCTKGDTPSASKPCSYTTFIVGESTHDHKGEQDLALEMIDHVGSIFRKGSFALREESVGTGTARLGDGILTGGVAATASQAVIKRHGIAAARLADGDQFSAQTWVPALVKGTKMLITYTGSAHTAKEYYEHFKKALPRVYSMSPGKPILEAVRDANRRGLVLTINLVDEAMDDFEMQAYRDKLREFPDAWSYDNWLAAFKHDWKALFSSFSATTVYKIAEDVYWALVPPYSGLRYDEVVNIAWSDARLSDPIRKSRSWTLYDVFNNRVRFEDDNRRGKHYLRAEVDLANKKLVGPPVEENY